MKSYWIFVAILLPMIVGACLPLFHFREQEDRKKRERYIAIPVILNTILVYVLIFAARPSEPFVLFQLTDTLQIAFRMDGLACVFAGLVSGLWPLASFYAFEYIKHEGKDNKFFAFYTMTYGVTLGIATSANLITMYLFYELLTLVTVPLVMHAMDHRAIRAGLKYLTYSIGGASAGFIGIMILMNVGDPSLTFTYGGFITEAAMSSHPKLVLFGYLLCFFGFGVKAAIFPFHDWLPDAGVAPTPVTALLHAVAVVKAGVFAIMRVTFFCFGPAVLAGTWAQYTAMLFAAFTIVFGSTMAWKDQHIKRRLAYSTVSNLSYIIFGATLMTPLGFQAAMTHMIFHGVMKITLFFCAGAIMYKTHREYVPQLYGFGWKMPKTFFAFTVGSLALTGVPLLCGFVSKFRLASAAAVEGTGFAFAGIVALMLSAVLTAGYTLTIVIRAYFPGKDFNFAQVRDVEDPNNYMILPLFILCTAMLVFGVGSIPLTDALWQIATGLM